MRLAPIITLCILGVIFKDVIALPCLSTVTKTKFEATRKVLTDLGKNIKNKIKKLDDDMESLVADFKKKQWYKHNGHCYYFGSEKLSWFKSEQQCKQIGGHLAKIEDSTENKWIFDKRPKKDHYWMGLTDLKEGEFRWSYDQTLASFTSWYSGWGKKGTSYNCGLMYQGTYTWLDYPCENFHGVLFTNVCLHLLVHRFYNLLFNRLPDTDMPADKKDKKKEEATPTVLKGVYVFPNGDKYEGDYLHGTDGSMDRSGMGIHVTTDGTMYEGEWNQDKMNGQGTLKHPTGARYEGQFVNNQFHGLGTYTWPNNSAYTGQFVENRLEGGGEFTDTDGQVWEGTFRYRAAPGLRFKLNLD